MIQQVVSPVQQIVWDDGIVTVFSFAGVTGKSEFSGFYHINAEDWIETVKFSARNSVPITISYDDALVTNYSHAPYLSISSFSFFLLVDLHG